MTLLINTSKYNLAEIALLSKNQIISQKTFVTERQLSHKLIPSIKKLLEENHSTLSQLTGIHVNLGPGSFTSLRIGISVANALAFALNIPINENKCGAPIFPCYGKEPNITEPHI